MPIITQIQPQKKRTGYYNIFVDSAFFCSLSDLQLASWQLQVGQELTQLQLNTLNTDSQQGKAYDRALFYLKYGPRTAWQMRQYLTKKGFSEPQIVVVVERLTKENYLNDLDFAFSFVRTRQLLKPRSKKMLNLELKKRGIEKEVIEKVIVQNDEASDIESIKKIIEKKQKKYQEKEKMLQFLARQGFNYSDIKCALEEFSSWQ